MPDMRALVLLRALGKMCEVIKTFPEDLDADNAGDEISKKGLYIKRYIFILKRFDCFWMNYRRAEVSKLYGVVIA